MNGTLLIVGMVVGLWGLAVLVLTLGWNATQSRSRALRVLAANRGLAFIAPAPRTPDPEYSHFNAFTRGTSPRPFNTLESRDRRLRAGDFAYDIGALNDRSTGQQKRFSYILARVGGPETPELIIHSEGIAGHAANAAGLTDLDFESAEFNRRFRVKCADKRFAFAVVNSRAMALLLDGAPPPLELRAGYLLITDGARVWRPSELDRTLSWLQRFLELWPEART